jgi:hypothetical protein
MEEITQEEKTELQTDRWFFAVMSALAGTGCICHFPGCTSEQLYRIRESMKLLATHWRSKLQGHHASFRAPWWMVHCYSHWHRASIDLEQWDAAEFDQTFPDGLDFKRYAGMWLWSVGVHCLNISCADLDAVQQAYGVACTPNPLLPLGSSVFDQRFTVTTYEELPAKDISRTAVDLAWNKARVR